MGTLYLLPMGHELTIRARRVLSEAALIVGEREWIGEFAAFSSLCIGESLSAGEWEAIKAALQRGDVVWLVGPRREWAVEMPASARELAAQGVEVSPLPTGDLLTAVLAASGLPLSRFTFLGSLSAADSRRAWEHLAGEPGTVACVVSTADLKAVVADARAALGERDMALWDGERLWRGTTATGVPRLAGDRCLLIVRGASQPARWPQSRVRTEARLALAGGASPRDAARDIAARSGWPRREVYQIVLEESLAR